VNSTTVVCCPASSVISKARRSGSCSRRPEQGATLETARQAVRLASCVRLWRPPARRGAQRWPHPEQGGAPQSARVDPVDPVRHHRRGGATRWLRKARPGVGDQSGRAQRACLRSGDRGADAALVSNAPTPESGLLLRLLLSRRGGRWM
jgi:hypothetical protein